MSLNWHNHARRWLRVLFPTSTALVLAMQLAAVQRLHMRRRLESAEPAAEYPEYQMALVKELGQRLLC